MRHQVLLASSFVASAALLASVAYAADPAVVCRAQKLKAAGKYSSCRLNAIAKGALKGLSPDYTKCDSTLTTKWSQAEVKAGPGVCPSEGDGGSMQSRLTVDASEVDCLLEGGQMFDGSCWYLGGIGENCTSVCTAHGRSYSNSTETFAGSSGSLANCGAVLATLIPPAGPCTTAWNLPPFNILVGVGLGCFWNVSEDCSDPFTPTYNWFGFRDTSAATTAAASLGDVARVCACN